MNNVRPILRGYTAGGHRPAGVITTARRRRRGARHNTIRATDLPAIAAALGITEKALRQTAIKLQRDADDREAFRRATSTAGG